MRKLIARASVLLASLLPWRPTLAAMKRLNGIQLSTEQLTSIAKAVRGKASCKFLVFGLGNDSPFWHGLNRRGVTIFLENREDWFQEVLKRASRLQAFMVRYDTELNQWESLLESTSQLEMVLPEEVTKEKWDVILVDGPEGSHDMAPGRMKSIYQSSRLIKEAGDIFVHDCERPAEEAYCRRYLKSENIRSEIAGPTGLLRHYQIRPEPLAV